MVYTFIPYSLSHNMYVAYVWPGWSANPDYTALCSGAQSDTGQRYIFLNSGLFFNPESAKCCLKACIFSTTGLSKSSSMQTDISLRITHDMSIKSTIKYNISNIALSLIT